MEEKLIKYISNEFIKEDDFVLTQGEDLLSGGILESLSAMKLISYIEKEFKINVLPKDMTIENFLSINAITDFIKSKQQ